MFYVDENGRFVLSIIRGDFDVNETKLKHLTNTVDLRHATSEEIREKINSEPGFISPVGIKDILNKGFKLIIVADSSLRTIRNAYGGANKLNCDMLNMNIDRDYKADIEGDIAMAQAGFKTKSGQKLTESKGIEVGNIFQLGYHYSTKMDGATFTSEDGSLQKYYMGCYGIGIGRTLATIVEVHHDDKGIIWPSQVAPYLVHLIGLDLQNEEIKTKVDALYAKLQEAEIEVLYDDRENTRAGEKFADADLIGIPVRLVISKRTGDNIEWKRRDEAKTELLTETETLQRLNNLITDIRSNI